MKSAIFTRPDAAEESAVDVETVLDNVVELDRLLDERSRGEVGALPVLELSKHIRIAKTADEPPPPPDPSARPPAGE